MRDRRTSSMDLEYLFEYSARFVSARTVRHVGFLLSDQVENAVRSRRQGFDSFR